MTADIITFRKLEPQEVREKKRREASQKNEAKIRRDVRRFREGLKSVDRQGRKLRRLKSPDAAVKLQRELGEWLYPLKSERGQLGTILNAADIMKNYRKRYALFGGENSGPQPIRKLEPYVRLADEIAAQLKLDRDIFLHNLLSPFGVFTFDRGADDEDALDLVDLFSSMAQVIARQMNLVQFFEEAYRTPGAMDDRGEICPAHDIDDERPTVLRDRAFEGLFDHWTQPQPIPNVPLFSLLERQLNARARLGTKISNSPKSRTRFLSKHRRLKTKIWHSAQVEIWREIGLAIGERNGPKSIGPMFTGRARVRVEIDGVRHDLLAPHAHTANLFSSENFPESEEPALLLGDDHLLPVVIYENSDELPWIEPKPRRGEPKPQEHNVMSYHAVTQYNVRRLLEQCESEYETELLLPLAPQEFQSRLLGKVGRSVEHALKIGLLEERLQDEIDALKDKLNNYIADRVAAIRKQDEAAFARWAAMQDSRA